MSFETATAESYMRRRYPRAFWDIHLLQLGGIVVQARKAEDAEWQRRELPSIFDKAERVRQICNALDDLLRDPNEDAWRLHTDYV